RRNVKLGRGRRANLASEVRKNTEHRMRLWSLHPSLLDARGLVALWRETLLAQKKLEGKTNGYIHNPQLQPAGCAGPELRLVQSLALGREDESCESGSMRPR